MFDLLTLLNTVIPYMLLAPLITMAVILIATILDMIDHQ